MKTLFLCLSLLYTVYGFTSLPHRARGGLAYRLSQHSLHAASTAWFDQELDHMNPARGQFKQRYFVDKTYWDEKSGPVFLEINGEGPAGPPSGFIVDLGKANKALLLGLEHRFYGESVPNKDFSVQNLKYLSSRQALADLANFIHAMEKTTGPRKWIVFGGSYSGALSAWFKLKYPDLVVAAHSSSGVVNAIYNFTGFDEQVSVAVGRDCADALRKTTAAFERGVEQGQGAALRELFGMSKTTSNGDFFYMMADSAAMGAQYGHKASLCTAMLNGDMKPEALISRFANWTNTFWGAEFGGNCFYDTQCLKSQPEKWQPTSRAWRWQKCSELAYFQIAPPHGSLRSTLYETPSYVTQQCLEIFGSVIHNTDVANHYYGGADIQGSNIFFSDFSDDPWQRASVIRTVKPDEPFVLVHCDGCGHCQDLHSPLPTDPAALTQERAKLAGWIADRLQ